MSTPFSVIIFVAIVLIGGFGWLGAALDFSTTVIITTVLIAIAVVVIVSLALIARMEKSDHDEQ